MPTLQNKTILVTGASQGLGEQVAKAYAEAGRPLFWLRAIKKSWKKFMMRLSKQAVPSRLPFVSI